MPKKPVKGYVWSTDVYRCVQMCMVLKIGPFGNKIRNSWKVLKCGTGEGWRRSVGQIVWKVKKQYV
jgi:hypothetical protein